MTDQSATQQNEQHQDDDPQDTAPQHEVTLEDALRLAQNHHQSGNLIIADRTYRDILNAVPDHFPTVMFLGVLLYQRGNHKEALKYLKQATKIEPENPQTWTNYGVVCAASHREDDAVDYFDKALEYDETHIEALTNKSYTLWLLGDYEGARDTAEKAVALQPKNLNALNNLGIAYGELNQLEDAEQTWQKILAIDPKSVKALSNWANTLRTMGRPELAEEKAREALDLDDENPDALNNLANVLRDRGQSDEALALYKKATDLRPDYFQAHYNVAVTLYEQERFNEAITAARYATSFNHDYAPAYGILAQCLTQLGHLDDAMQAAQKSVALAPTRAESYLALTETLIAVDRLDEAEAAMQEALNLGIHTARAYIQLADVRDKQNEHARAIEALDKAAEISPELPYIYMKKMQVYQSTPYIDKAWEAIEKAESLAPDHPMLTALKADLYLTTNNKEQAKDLITKAIDLNPDMPALYMNLASFSKIEIGSPHFEKIQEFLANKDIGPLKHTGLHFALSSSYEAAKDYDKAFEHLKAANDARKAGLPAGALTSGHVLDNLKQIYTPQHFKEHEGKGYSSDIPVFIVGMPRSGTTLTEQIISSHPDVYGAGELTYTGKVIRETGPLSPERAADMGAFYVDLVKELDMSGNAKRITDKLPANYMRIGLIKTILPHAKIIHCRRNPMDTCLSCYKQNFARGQYWSYDLDAMGREYQEYLDIMDYWRDVLPADSFLEIDYEQTVGDFENQARKLIDYVGLDWHDACLEPHKQKRSVLTASKAQVIKPVYQSSVEKWKRYETHLAPLAEMLVPDYKAG
ncbi:MAG: tetratricopeptide repeat protein [Alphaproteobacteria bacterium]|jgi:tetratricopeptide (TPR) repeat protein|nr:tetratricopeptide repeat protein [Alphaproteobacteria bacterium]MDP7222284.1 tetratricopeptide repeat protein [Alphaproteobacteria bacterium]